jgi:hypothetical protein
MNRLHSLLSFAAAVFLGFIPSARALNAQVEAVQNGTNFTYTVYNDEASGSTLSVDTFHLTTGAPFTVAATPDGWSFETDNSTYIEWFSTNSSPPFSDDIAPGASLGRFALQTMDPSSESLVSAVVSWDTSTNGCGPSLLTPVLSPSVTNLEPMLAVTTATGGGFQFFVAGYPSFSYVFQSSTNLLNWSPVTTNTCPFNIVEPASLQTPANFFDSIFFPDQSSWSFLPD